MAKNVTVVKCDENAVRELWRRRQEIRAQISALQKEDASIVETLSYVVALDTQNDSVQHFQIGDLKLKITPKIYRNVDTERAKLILENDSDARMLADIFKEKYELSAAKWRALTPDQQAIFTDCITISAGKPQIEEEK